MYAPPFAALFAGAVAHPEPKPVLLRILRVLFPHYEPKSATTLLAVLLVVGTIARLACSSLALGEWRPPSVSPPFLVPDSQQGPALKLLSFFTCHFLEVEYTRLPFGLGLLLAFSEVEFCLGHWLYLALMLPGAVACAGLRVLLCEEGCRQAAGGASMLLAVGTGILLSILWLYYFLVSDRDLCWMIQSNLLALFVTLNLLQIDPATTGLGVGLGVAGGVALSSQSKLQL
jgi:hypothetical protein